MRKHLLSVLASLFVCSATFAQVLSRDGRPVLPAPRDWGLGIDLTRMVNVGAMKVSPAAPLVMGKYMIDSTHAFRIGVRAAFRNTTVKNRTVDRAAAAGSVQAYPAPQEMKDNVWRRTDWQLVFSVGKETRRGDRLQGIYGWDAMISLGRLSDKFSYGNALDVSPLARIAVDKAGDGMSSPELGSAHNIDSLPPIQGVTGSARVIERHTGLMMGVGARIFAGAEYFFLPKLSIGVELGWGIAVTTSGRSRTVLESEGTSTAAGSTGPEIRKTTIDGGNTTRIAFDHDALNSAAGLSASMRLMLYF